MLYKTWKHKFTALGAAGLLTAPLAALACGPSSAATTALTSGGIYSSYFNATDMLSALGYYPDAVAVSSDHTLYSDFLKPTLGEQNRYNNVGEVVNTGKYEILAGPRIMDGQQVNSEQMAALELKAVILNEWYKADAPRLAGVAPHLLYTTMADEHGRVPGTAAYGLKDWQMSVMDCFSLLVSDLVLAYPAHAATLNARYASFKAATAARYRALNAATNALRGKSILVLEPSNASTAQEIIFTSVWSDTIYEPLYASAPDRGLGMVLPRPVGAPATGALTSLAAYGLNDFGTTNGSGDFSLRARDSAALISAYAQTSDYVLVLKNPQGVWPDNFDAAATQAAQAVQKNKDAAHVRVVNRDWWYDPIWGPRGVNVLLDQINRTFALNVSLPALPTYEPLGRLR